MPGRQAKVLDEACLKRLLRYASSTSSPERDVAMVLLSFKAGLRASEIAKLEWSMVLDPRGRLSDTISVRDAIAKKRGGRYIPMHADIRIALRRLQALGSDAGSVICSARGGALRANSVVNWFVAAFRALGLEGCSSHSGRRTFITAAAQNAWRVGCSLRDVQRLAGHRSIETTQGYMEADPRRQKRLISSI
ncbi:site-specific integrase [Roseomonas hellenica]|uniref:Site-specific integrase n=1 Tax=Plastoroseomonas hellenica TaxID=2687306 RepID=A0ABS5EUN2_9PROT|nr:site-specific integrase [Plastoroseomonas hellenica]MBR0664010.1 site-specific integrase [Plastoroseomonas hellenica]